MNQKNNVIIAEDLFRQYSNLYQFEEGDVEYLINKEDFIKAMIEFAKYHVEKALIVYENNCRIIRESY